MSASGRRGFTLLETMFAVLILTISALAAAASLIGGLELAVLNRETLIAEQALRSQLETMQNDAFADVYTTYNTNPNDDPGVVGSAPGATFAVAGLGLRVGDADGRAGSVIFPTDALLGGLRENVFDAGWGMPFDLSGDAAIDANDHAGDYRLLPVRVRVEWRGAAGDRSLELSTVLMER